MKLAVKFLIINKSLYCLDSSPAFIIFKFEKKRQPIKQRTQPTYAKTVKHARHEPEVVRLWTDIHHQQ